MRLILQMVEKLDSVVNVSIDCPFRGLMMPHCTVLKNKVYGQILNRGFSKPAR